MNLYINIIGVNKIALIKSFSEDYYKKNCGEIYRDFMTTGKPGFERN